MPNVDPLVAEAVAQALITPFFYLVFFPTIALGACASLAGR
ncbi:MAG: hypothetical protein ACYS1E_19395 [Planctomycetota bacterium]|jgi:hypothetical protein